MMIAVRSMQREIDSRLFAQVAFESEVDGRRADARWSVATADGNRVCGGFGFGED